MNLLLKRRPSTARTTIGDLYHGERWLMLMLEDVIRAPGVKVAGHTAIAPGIYEVVMTASPKYLNQYGVQVTTPMLREVPLFTGIRVHPMSTSKDSEGCLGPGLKWDPAAESISGSGLAYGMFCALVGGAIAAGDRVYLEIENAG